MTHEDDIATDAQHIGGIDRRTLLAATGVAAAAGLMAACGSSSSSSSSGGDQVLVAAAQVPVGGGVVIEEPPVVVTQPTEGDLRAFTAICPHQGCTVSEVVDQQIRCRCHGSRFSIVDGSVIEGPAPTGLAAEAIAVRDGSVTLA